METGYKVKQSKIIFILGCVSGIILFSFFFGFSIGMIVSVFVKDYTDEDKLGYVISSSICFCFSIVIIIILIYVIYIYINQVDVYMENKLVRKIKDKIVFELEYSQIKTIKEGYFTILIFCEQPIRKANGKKGPRTIIEQYSVKDKNRIKQIIGNSITYNLNN